MIIGTCGFCSTGSSAVSDYLKEFDENQVLDGVEFTYVYLPDGLEDLYYHTTNKISRDDSSSIAIPRFKKFIKHYEKYLSWWCSEPDGGQSAAFNKGFAHATGRFLTWLNADDVLMPGTLKAFSRAVEKYPVQEWFVGGVMWLTKDMRVIRCGRGRHMSRVRAEHGQLNVCGPSSFFSKDLYERAGKIDERYHYTMDTDLWLRFALNEGLSFKPFVRYAWGLRLHEDAKMSGHNFNPDGSLATNAFSDEALLRDAKKRMQLEREDAWTKEKLPTRKGKIGRFKDLFCVDYVAAIVSRIDTKRVRGMNYLKAMEIVG